MISVRPETDSLERLRDALRSGDTRAAQRASDPLIARLFAPLLAYSERLVASAGRPLPVDGADLVQDAWLAALRRLTTRDEIQSEEHLYRLLRRSVKTRFLDHLDYHRRHRTVELDAPHRHPDSPSAAVTLADTLIARERADSETLFGADGTLLPVVEAVFLGDAALEARSGRRPRRRARQYQALVLFHLAELLRDLAPDDLYGVALLRRWLKLLGIPDALWLPVEAAVQSGADDAGVLAVINQFCETQVRDRATLSVLRYELHKLARPGSR